MTSRVSVIMAVFNGGPLLRRAVDSVLAQEFDDFELIVVDDGSTDGAAEMLASIADRRLRLVRRPHAGLTRTLNHALGLASASLVARLDADDVAAAQRLACQHAFLEAHPDVGLLGTGAVEVDVQGRRVRTVVPPEHDAAIRRMLIRRNPLVHSSVMMRARLIERVGGYDEELPVAQDYDLWLRLAPLTRFANLPEPLVTRRLVPGRISVTRDDERLRAEMRARWRAVRRGTYPWWSAGWVARSALALALPRPLRDALRRVKGGERLAGQ